MPDLSAATPHWIVVALIWVGFGGLAGLVARMLLPLGEPSRPLATFTIGIAGSAVGLGVLSFALGNPSMNPISLPGFLAAIGGALSLLIGYHVLNLVVHRPTEAVVPGEDDDMDDLDDNEDEDDEDDDD